MRLKYASIYLDRCDIRFEIDKVVDHVIYNSERNEESEPCGQYLVDSIKYLDQLAR